MINVLFACVVALGTTGCPHRRHLVAPVVPTTGNNHARQRFEEAKAEFERDKTVVTGKFESIARDYPNDPIAPYARLYAGMSALRAGDYADAVADLEPIARTPTDDAALKARGRLFLGLAYTYRGRYRDALPLLSASGEALNTDDEKAEWLAAMAEANANTAHPVAALGYYDRWYKAGRASERAYAVARIRALVDNLDAASAQRAYQHLDDHHGPVAALLGVRLATAFTSQGDFDRAAEIRDDTRDARKQLGLALGPAHAAAGNPRQVGAVLPLSGRRARVGALVMRGLALAAGTFDDGTATGVGASGAPRPFALTVRNSHSQVGGAIAAVKKLAAAGVIAVLGPIDSGSVEAAAKAATNLGVPLMSLAPRSDRQVGQATAENSPYVFHVVHSAEDRARSLAHYAVGVGKRDFAILAPKNGYGRALAKAFRDEVVKRGGDVVVESWYDPNTTVFVNAVKRLRKPWQAVFVPDAASRLELIAPALAAANLMSLPADAKRPKHGRKILLLSTAEFLTPGYVRSAARYSYGAVFAPGFYPDRTDDRIRDFVDRFENAFGRPPTYLDAYAYDAALVVRAAVESGARTRDEVVASAQRSVVAGVTGKISFTPSHERRDDGVLYRVERDSGGDYAIRAMRK